MDFMTVPKAPEVINRTIIVGNMMGTLGVLTWNGLEEHQENGNREGILVIFHNV